VAQVQSLAWELPHATGTAELGGGGKFDDAEDRKDF